MAHWRGESTTLCITNMLRETGYHKLTEHRSAAACCMLSPSNLRLSVASQEPQSFDKIDGARRRQSMASAAAFVEACCRMISRPKGGIERARLYRILRARTLANWSPLASG